jgi:hypothetical protein
MHPRSAAGLPSSRALASFFGLPISPGRPGIVDAGTAPIPRVTDGAPGAPSADQLNPLVWASDVLGRSPRRSHRDGLLATAILLELLRR